MKKTIFKTVLIALVAIGSITTAHSQNLDGRQIIEKVYNRDQGNDQQLGLTMRLINKQGRAQNRYAMQIKKISDEGEKSILKFQSPADVKDISFLSISYNSDKIDEQMLYLPALHKSKKITGEERSNYFMGTDYSYDDLGSRKPDDDTHKLSREEILNGKVCYVVESVSKTKDYQYSKTISWIDKSTFIEVKKEFYDKDGKLLKILTINETKEYAGYLLITKSEMMNVQNKHKTIIQLENARINTGLKDELFSIQNMMRK